MFLNCTGSANGPTIILEAGTGDSSEVWSAVQKQVGQFAHDCSHDRLGLRKNEKLRVAHTADEIVDDLHQLLQAAHVPPPYVMAFLVPFTSLAHVPLPFLAMRVRHTGELPSRFGQ